MPSNISVLHPCPPKYNINQTVYARASAIKGYMEPFYIHNVALDPSNGRWLYSFNRKMNIVPNSMAKFNAEVHGNVIIPQYGLLPIQLYEDQILTFCEAIVIQISVLQNQYNEAVKVLQEKCGGQIVTQPPIVRTYEDATFQTALPKPRFGVNETVYLMETSQAAGRLEPMRISNIEWDNRQRHWTYVFHYEPRPEFNMTVGDRDNWRRPHNARYSEGMLGTFHEAQSARVSFLEQALKNSQTHQAVMCGGSEGSQG